MDTNDMFEDISCNIYNKYFLNKLLNKYLYTQVNYKKLNFS